MKKLSEKWMSSERGITRIMGAMIYKWWWLVTLLFLVMAALSLLSLFNWQKCLNWQAYLALMHDFDECICERHGNSILAYTMEEDDSDYDFESLGFRSNLGMAWRTSGKRFGLEFYPVDFTIARGGRARYSCSLNAVARVF